jgi:ankyrin repeat protein
MKHLFRDSEFLNSPGQANTSLMLAAGDEDFEDVRQLIESGNNINVKNVHGQTALDWAANFAQNDMENAIRIIDLLLNHRADINAQDNQGITALMHAASRGNLVLLRHLLQRGADPNLRRDDGSPEGATVITFLESAPSLRRGRKKVIKTLEAAGGTRNK